MKTIDIWLTNDLLAKLFEIAGRYEPPKTVSDILGDLIDGFIAEHADVVSTVSTSACGAEGAGSSPAVATSGLSESPTCGCKTTRKLAS